MKQSIDETITTRNIDNGVVVKNYKELCSLLNEKVKSGKSKTLQLIDWERFFSYERDGNKFKILEVYSTPKAKERKLPDAIVIRNRTVLYNLVPELSEDEEACESHRTTKDLCILLGVCNEKFYKNREFSQLKLKGNPKNLAMYKDSIFGGIFLNDVRTFYDEVNARGRGLIANLVKAFYEQCGVEITKVYRINDSRYSTDDEYAEIKNAIDRTLQLEAYKKEVDGVLVPSTEAGIFLKKKPKQFYIDVAKDSELQALGIDEFYTVYKFRFTKDIVSKLDEYEKSVEKIDNYHIALNQRSFDYHRGKTTKKGRKDYHEYMSFWRENMAVTDKESEEYKNQANLSALQPGYSEGRRVLIDKLVKQYEEVKVARIGKDGRPAFMNSFPLFGKP